MSVTRLLSVSVALAIALGSRAVGQGSVPPGTLRGMQRTVGLNPPAVPGANVHQVHMVQLPGDPDGTYTCALTVGSLPAANGGVGGNDILTGKYDALNDTFTPDLHAAGLNGSVNDFGFMFHHSGLIATWDRPGAAGTVQIATRQNLNSAWVARGPVTGLQPGPNYYDPALADLNGRLILLYLSGGVGAASIAWCPLDVNTLQAGPSYVIVRPARAGSEANSPTPIVTSAGQLIGLSHHDVLGSDNDHYFSFDLDPVTPSVLFFDTPTWLNNGGYAGGVFYDAESTPAPYHILDLETVWWTGGRAAIGTSMEVTVNAPGRLSGVPPISFFVASRNFLPNPIPVAA